MHQMHLHGESLLVERVLGASPVEVNGVQDVVAMQAPRGQAHLFLALVQFENHCERRVPGLS